MIYMLADTFMVGLYFYRPTHLLHQSAVILILARGSHDQLFLSQLNDYKFKC